MRFLFENMKEGMTENPSCIPKNKFEACLANFYFFFKLDFTNPWRHPTTLPQNCCFETAPLQEGTRTDLVLKMEPSGNGPLFTEVNVFQRILKPDMIEAFIKKQKGSDFICFFFKIMGFLSRKYFKNIEFFLKKMIFF